MQKILGSIVILFVFGFPNIVKAEPFAYISNAAGQSVTILDTATDTVVFTVPINTSVSGVGVSPDGNRVYVTRSSGSSNVAVIDTDPSSSNFRQVITIVSLTGNNAQGITVSPDGTRAYVANSSSSFASVIDTATNTEVDMDPITPGIQGIEVGSRQFRVVISPDGKRLYLSKIFANRLSVVDLDPLSPNFQTEIASIPVGTRPIGMVVTPDNARVYVANFLSDTVSVIDTVSNTVIATVPVGDGPQGNLSVTPDGTKVYVGNSSTNTVSVIDTATNQEVDRIIVGSNPRGVAAHPDGTRVYVANIGILSSSEPDTISIIDTGSSTVVNTITPPCPVRCSNNPVEIAFATSPANQPPLADAGPDQVVEATSSSGAIIWLDGSASDDPDGDPLTFSWTGTFPEGGGAVLGELVQVTLPIGTHTINLLVDDGRGGTATDFLVVQVRDTTPPVLSAVPANIIAEATSVAGAVVTYSLPTAIDAVDPSPTVTCLPSSGSTYPLGTTTVNCTTTDASGNSDSASFTVQVVDTTAPETSITSAIDGDGNSLTNGEATFSQDMTFTFVATDAVSVTGFECRLDGGAFSSCTSPQAFSGLTTGAHAFDARASDGSLNTDATPASFTWTILTPEGAIQQVDDELDIIINANPGSSLADKLEDAQDKLEVVLEELGKTPPDRQAALGNLEGAVGELEAAVNDGLLDPVLGSQLMDQLTEAARVLAVQAIDDAIAQGGDAGDISDAQQSLADGDSQRTNGEFKDAVSKYKDALSKAESALP